MTTLTITFNGEEYKFTEDKPVVFTLNGRVTNFPADKELLLDIIKKLESQAEGE